MVHFCLSTRPCIGVVHFCIHNAPMHIPHKQVKGTEVGQHFQRKDSSEVDLEPNIILSHDKMTCVVAMVMTRQMFKRGIMAMTMATDVAITLAMFCWVAKEKERGEAGEVRRVNGLQCEKEGEASR